MGLVWNGDAAAEAILQEAARRLMAAAKYLQNEDRSRRGVVNPRPYKQSAAKGTYPKLRSGRLRAGIITEPNTIAEIIAGGRIRIGYSTAVPYGAHLAKAGWKGIQDTAQDIRDQLLGIMRQGQAVKV